MVIVHSFHLPLGEEEKSFFTNSMFKKNLFDDEAEFNRIDNG